jgi:hypothetical protein
MVEQMQAQDARVVFDSLRPMADELWNFVDGQRTVGAIIEAVCLEFDFDLAPALFIPLVEGMEKTGILTLSAEQGITESGSVLQTQAGFPAQ